MRTNEQIDKLWSEDVEKVLLGSIMVDPAVLPAVKTVIGDERAFFLVKHRYIFEALDHVIRTTGHCTIELAMKRLQDKNQLSLIGGGAYLSGLVAEAPTAIYANTYAGILKTFAQRRLLVQASQNILDLANNIDLSVNDALAQSMQSIRSIVEHSTDGSLTLRQRYEDYLDLISAKEDKRYIPSPYPTLNQVLGGGIRRGNYTIMTAPPGGNKTMLATAWMAWATQQKWTNGMPFKVLVHSIEMGAVSELMPRVMSAWTGLTIKECERPSSTDSTGLIVNAYNRFVDGTNCEIDDNPSVTIDDIQLRAEVFRPDLLILDYAQLIRVSQKKQSLTQYEAHNLIASRLKEIAKLTDCAILLLAQMNSKGAEATAGKLSQSTIEGSRAWNQGASAVLILQNYRISNQNRIGISTEKSRFSTTASANTASVPTLQVIDGTAQFKDIGMFAIPREEEGY